MREFSMFERCITQPVLGNQNLPSSQGIQPYAFVPSYQMSVGGGSYQTGYRWYPSLMQIDKPKYTSSDVPFQKLSIDYKP